MGTIHQEARRFTHPPIPLYTVNPGKSPSNSPYHFSHFFLNIYLCAHAKDEIVIECTICLYFRVVVYQGGAW